MMVGRMIMSLKKVVMSNRSYALNMEVSSVRPTSISGDASPSHPMGGIRLSVFKKSQV